MRPVNDQSEVLLDVAHRLNAAAIPYMVSGSTAMNFYARPRMTRDIDIVVELSGEDVHRLVRVLSPDYYAYLSDWAERLGVSERLREMRP